MAWFTSCKRELDRRRRRRLAKDVPGMRVVGIDFNPAPDAEDRLHRLFTILLKLADDSLQTPSSPDDGVGEEG